MFSESQSSKALHKGLLMTAHFVPRIDYVIQGLSSAASLADDISSWLLLFSILKGDAAHSARTWYKIRFFHLFRIAYNRRLDTTREQYAYRQQYCYCLSLDAATKL